eukprot:9427974-Lingulodinium_polyedra.AAC.1
MESMSEMTPEVIEKVAEAQGFVGGWLPKGGAKKPKEDPMQGQTTLRAWAPQWRGTIKGYELWLVNKNTYKLVSLTNGREWTSSCDDQ